jgi:hypothetical protein
MVTSSLAACLRGEVVPIPWLCSWYVGFIHRGLNHVFFVCHGVRRRISTCLGSSNSSRIVMHPPRIPLIRAVVMSQLVVMVIRLISEIPNVWILEIPA